MTGAVLSYQQQGDKDSSSVFKKKEMETFLKILSAYTGLDFLKVMSDFVDDLNGLLNYLNKRRTEMEIRGFTKDEITLFLTLNLIASFSLWLGFNKAETYSKRLEKAPKDGMKDHSSSKTHRDHNKINYKVGVVIPTNLMEQNDFRLDRLRNLVGSLIRWNRIEKVWIVGRISERANEILKKFDKVELIKVKKDHGPAKLRNIGIEMALLTKVDLLIFMDDDVVNPISDDFISLCNKAVKSTHLYFPKIEAYSNTCFDWFHDVDGTLNGVYDLKGYRKSLVYGTTCVMVAPVTIFKNGIRFDNNFPLAAGEDIDFCLRVRSKGYKILPADNVIIKHDYGYKQTDNSLIKFVSRFVRYGEGNRFIKEKHPEYFNILTHSARRPTHERSLENVIIPRSIENLSKITERLIG